MAKCVAFPERNWVIGGGINNILMAQNEGALRCVVLDGITQWEQPGSHHNLIHEIRSDLKVLPTRSIPNMLKTVRKTIEASAMLDRGEHILVAVSGGPDSIALLQVLFRLTDEYRLRLTVAHLNHGIRGEEAKREQEFVSNLCAEMGITCICKTVEIRMLQVGSGKSIEEIGREERYQFLHATAESCGARKIATGHHRDDQAETVLINLIRGSGTEGLRGITPVREGRIIRPLLHVSKGEILAFLNRERLAYVVDKSNLSPMFLRNRIRNELIPELATLYNPRIVEGLCHMAEIVRREDDYMENTVRQVLHQWGIVPGAAETLMPIAPFQKLHEAMQARIIKYLLEAVAPSGNGIGYRHIEAVLAISRPSLHSHVSLDLPCLICVDREGSVLRIRRVFRRQIRRDRRNEITLSSAYSYPVEVPGMVYLKVISRNIRFEMIDKPDLQEMKDQPRAAFMDYERISPPLILRNYRSGDRIDLLGMKGMKKVKSYFIDSKIPSTPRNNIPLLVDDRSVIWITGERISDRVKVTERTKKVLKAEMV
jgi:tRNA(Ile)-lysidine synthase